jgi:putative intracellular protease/amidase
MTTLEATHRFFEHYCRQDVDAMVGLFTENGTIDYIPAAMAGLAAETGRKVWTGLIEGFLDLTNEITAVAVAIYLTGGHGVMFDFTESKDLADFIAKFYETGKVVSAACHGSDGLLNVKLSNGEEPDHWQRYNLRPCSVPQICPSPFSWSPR